MAKQPSPIAHHFERTLRSANWYVRRLIRPLLSPVRRFLAQTGLASQKYRRWIRRYDVVTPDIRSKLEADISTWPVRPLISVIMPSYNINPKWMRLAIDSVRNQIYPHWQLCISDDASSLAGVRPLLERYAAEDRRFLVTFRSQNGHISENSNTALALATGDYIALIDADDLLSEDALFWVAREIVLHPDVDLLFSDEDKIDRRGKRFNPYFKSAWNPALMLSQNAFSHLGVYRRKLVQQIGGFRKGYEGSQDYDLVLRCAEATTIDRIRHIPRVLYHWRALPSSTAIKSSAKAYAWNAGRMAIADHLQRSGISAQVSRALPTDYQIEYDLPAPAPLVSIVVPTTLSNSITAKCLGSVLAKSNYDAFELLILSDARDAAAARRSLEFAAIMAHPRVQIIEYENMPFNYSRVSNLGARRGKGDLLCFLNDDVEVITPSWLERLAARAMLDGVGAVGPMLYYPNNTIQHAGVVLGIGGVADHAFRNRRQGYLGYFGRGALEQDYSCVTAACMVVRRQVFEAVGGFDETLPVAFNDVDLCIKIRRTGARIIWTPRVEMYHHESLTLGHHDSPARREQFVRDVTVMRERWKGVLEADPCYNPNLSLARSAMFSLAWPPRIPCGDQLLDIGATTSISRTSRLSAGSISSDAARSR